jgi:hypothetical protein
MALKFNDAKGTAQKDRADSYEYKDGENRIRLVGDILARYVYWIKGENNKPLPFECLAFNRETETFDNSEEDHVKEFYPDLKCSWAYAIQGIANPGTDNPELKIVNLKKKLFKQILDAAEDLGDPTDPETGWDVVFKKTKTGPLPINVEYQLMVLRCKQRPLSDKEKELIAELKSMDEVLPRPTAQQQKDLLTRLTSGSSENVDEEAAAELEVA